MNSSDGSQTPQRTPSVLTLHLRGLKIPSFKNRKRICGNRLVTEPGTKAAMKLMEDSFASQLQSAFQTAAAATLTGLSQASWIRLCVPGDDCWTQIPELHVNAVQPSGEWEAAVTIERLP